MASDRATHERDIAARTAHREARRALDELQEDLELFRQQIEERTLDAIDDIVLDAYQRGGAPAAHQALDEIKNARWGPREP